MEFDGEIIVERCKVEARCTIGECAFTFRYYGESLKGTVEHVRGVLTDHRYLHHKDLGHVARVNLVFADGVTV